MKNEFIESCLKEFDYKTDTDNFEEYSDLDKKSLYEPSCYPESEYELDREKIRKFIQQKLQQAIEQGKKETFSRTYKSSQMYQMGFKDGKTEEREELKAWAEENYDEMYNVALKEKAIKVIKMSDLVQKLNEQTIDITEKRSIIEI